MKRPLAWKGGKDQQHFAFFRTWSNSIEPTSSLTPSLSLLIILKGPHQMCSIYNYLLTRDLDCITIGYGESVTVIPMP